MSKLASHSYRMVWPRADRWPAGADNAGWMFFELLDPARAATQLGVPTRELRRAKVGDVAVFMSGEFQGVAAPDNRGDLAPFSADPDLACNRIAKIRRCREQDARRADISRPGRELTAFVMKGESFSPVYPMNAALVCAPPVDPLEAIAQRKCVVLLTDETVAVCRVLASPRAGLFKLWDCTVEDELRVEHLPVRECYPICSEWEPGELRAP